MTYHQVIKYCATQQGVNRKTLNTLGTAFAFEVADTIFAYFETGAPIQWRLSVRVSEDDFNNLHFPPKVLQSKDKLDDRWLTIMRVENFDETQLNTLIDYSYARAQAISQRAAAPTE